MLLALVLLALVLLSLVLLALVLLALVLVTASPIFYESAAKSKAPPQVGTINNQVKDSAGLIKRKEVGKEPPHSLLRVADGN